MAPPRNPGRPGRRPQGPSASTPKARPSAPKAAPARPAWDDPNAYRSPGFQDQPQTAYRVDYEGLPRDVEDEAPEGSPPAGPVAASGRPHAGPPRGMYGRRPDRAGTDPNAYRSPGYAGAQRGGSRPLTAAERLAAIGQATRSPSDETPEAEPEVDDSQAALLGGPRRG